MYRQKFRYKSVTLILLKWGWDLLRPVSNTATLTPAPVTPISQRTSAWRIEVICLGTDLKLLYCQHYYNKS